MQNITILDEDIKPYKDVATLGENFDITKHINDHIYMFGGKLITAKILILNELAITYVIDWFGNNAKIYKDDDKFYAAGYSDDGESVSLDTNLSHDEKVALSEVFKKLKQGGVINA